MIGFKLINDFINPITLFIISTLLLVYGLLSLIFKKMIRLVFLTLCLLYTNFSIGQKYYDSNDLKYYLDFTDKMANLKFLDYKINGPIEEIRTFYGKMFTVIKGDSIHWVLEQSSKKNKYASYLIIKGDYRGYY